MKRIFNKKSIAFAILSLLMCAVICVAASADYTPITVDESGLTLENNHIVYSFDNKGRITSYFYKDTHTEYLGSRSYMAFLTDDLLDYYPTSLKVNDIDKTDAWITLSFQDGTALDFKITVYDEFFVFELLSKIPDKYISAELGDLKLNSAYDGKTMATFAYGLSYSVQMSAYPSRYEAIKYVSCTVDPALDHGINPRFATIGCPAENYYDVLRFIVEFVANPDHIAVSKMGGAYAMTADVVEKAVQDYAIVSGTISDSTIRHYLNYNVTQFDFHQGEDSFIQGSMDFVEAAGDTAKGFKEAVTDRIKKIAKDEYNKEVLMGLHTYAYYVDVDNTELLSQPEAVQQLEYFEDEIYTLSENISKTQKTVPVFEDISGFSTTTGTFVYNSRYIRIDDELMYVDSVSVSGNHLNVRRAQCGTLGAIHKKGESVYHLTGIFGMLCPQMGSELFKDIAKYTARAYVEGGFEMIYIDAIDGLNRHTTNVNYYFGMFLTEIMKEINRYREIDEYTDVPDPIFEFSSMASSAWNVRTRMGAMDTVCRGYKDFIAYHTRDNANNTMNYTTNIGWYALYNSENEGPVITHTEHWDTVDLLGKNIIAHNMGYSYNGFGEAAVASQPLHKANGDLLLKYLKLRDAHYFTDEVIEKISGYRDEWKLIENEDGEYGFEHRSYSELKYNALTDNKTANNPFEAQIPKLIRIQALNTDAETEYVTLTDYDQNTPLIDYVSTGTSGYKKDLSSAVSLGTYKTLAVRVYGNGLGGNLSVALLSDDATYSYVIPMDFTGWRTVILSEVDNGINDQDFYNCGSYAFNRNFNRSIETVVIKRNGNMTGVKLDYVKLAKRATSSITNPGVSYNGSTVTFDTVLENGSYIEFDGTKAIEYTFIGTPKEIEFTTTGSLVAPKGDFDITLLGTGANTVDREWITFGFAGEQIFNDLSNEAVEEILVKTTPRKTSYIVGETLDTEGLCVREVMNTGRVYDVESGWTVDPVTFTEAGIKKIPVTYEGFTAYFTVVVHEVTPVSLEITKPADKNMFYEGQMLDTAGLELTLTYNNGNTEVITSGYQVSHTMLDKAGAFDVVVTYNGFTVSYPITVETPSLYSIFVAANPIKTSYKAGELFSTAGMVVMGNYTAGVQKEITDYTYTPNGALSVTDTEIVITKNGISTTLPITVTAAVDETAFTLTANDALSTPGASAQVVINAESGTLTNVQALEFTVEYAPEFTFNSVTVTGLPEGWDIWSKVDAATNSVGIALVDESSTPVCAVLGNIDITLTFDVSDTVAVGTSYTVTVKDISATDHACSLVEGEGSSASISVDNKIILTSDSDYVIDRENGFLFISHEGTSHEEFYSNFGCDVTLVTGITTAVPTGATVKLESDGVVYDSLTVVLIGDVTGNGVIDTVDYTMVKKIYSGTSYTAARNRAADVNGNGYVDTNDYLQIKKHFTGVIDIYSK